MKVLWLTQLPYSQLPTSTNKVGHPVPWIASLAKPLAKFVDLTIMSNNGKIAEDKEIVIDNIKYKFIKTGSGTLNILTFNKKNAKILRENIAANIDKYDLIHIHGSEGMFHEACWNLPIPKVLSVQGILDEYYNYLSEFFSIRKLYWYVGRQVELKYIPQIRNFMCRTNWDKAWVKKVNPSARIFDCWECLRPDFFETIIHPSGKSKLIYLSGTDYIKGYREILTAFNTALTYEPNLHLVYVRRGNEREQLEIDQYIKTSNLTNIDVKNISFINRLNAQEVIAQYTDCFCLVHPSYIDNSPNTICEAQVLGLPVIASNVGGVSSLIEDGVTGILTSLNYLDISEKIVTLYRDNNKQKSISINAIKVARERHNTTKIVEETLLVYKQLIDEGNY